MEEKLEIVKKVILERIECDAILLFGSYARGTQNDESDIDIAVKAKNEISKKELFYISQELEEIVKIDVDLIDLCNIGDGFKYEILMNGKVLYCKNELQFELYKLDMYREYLELNESRKQIIDDIKKGGGHNGK